MYLFFFCLIIAVEVNTRSLSPL